MMNSQPRPNFLQLAQQRPAVQRKYTASPSRHQACTPPAAHGFIPLGTSSPLPTFREEDQLGVKYFSLLKKDIVLSPPPTQYEPHSFIPFYSVAVNEKGQEAGDYFSHALTDTQPRAAKGSFYPSTIGSSEMPAPRFEGFISTADIPIEELRQPTGSPILGCDIVPSPEWHWKLSSKPVPQLRSGGIYEPLEEAAEEERQRCELTGSPRLNLEETLTRLEDEDLVFMRTLKRLERTVSTSFIPINRISSSSSLRSGNSGSVYDIEFGGVDQEIPKTQSIRPEQRLTLLEALAVTEDAWQHKAETTAMPDSSDDDDNKPSEVVSKKPVVLSQVVPDGTNARGSGVMAQYTEQRISEMQWDEQSGLLSPLMSSLVSATSEPELKPLPPSLALPRQHSSVPIWCTKDDTLYKIAYYSSPKELAKCLLGPTINIINGSTGEMYVPDVPERMLLHFCGEAVLNRLVPSYGATQDVLEIPASEAEGLAIARVVRFMKRCCGPTSHQGSGEMRIPPSIREGIETIRACRVLGLAADADRIEKVMVRDWMGSKSWDMMDEHIELIWNGYFGAFRNSELGDAIIWFTLNEVQKNSHGLAEEMWILLDHEEHDTLRQRVQEEMVARNWRTESRVAFLERSKVEREKVQAKRARCESKAREKESRIEDIRAMYKRDNPESSELTEAMTSTRWAAPKPRLASGTVAGTDSKSEKKDGASHSPIKEKPLPELPTGPNFEQGTQSQPAVHSDHEQHSRSTLELYKDFVRLMSTASRPASSRDRLSKDIQIPAPKKKKKRSKWGRSMNSAFSG